MGVGSAELQTMLDVVCDNFKSQFDPADPSMDASGGRAVWDAQCEAACERLGEKVTELIMQIEEDLHLGQFYQGWDQFLANSTRVQITSGASRPRFSFCPQCKWANHMVHLGYAPR